MKEAIVKGLSGIITTREGSKDLNIQIAKRFEAMDRSFETMDKRFEVIDKRFEADDKRFEIVDKRFDILETDVKNNTKSIELLADVMRSDFSNLQDHLNEWKRP